MVDSDADTPGERLAEPGDLDLLECEATAGPLLQVVLWGQGRGGKAGEPARVRIIIPPEERTVKCIANKSTSKSRSCLPISPTTEENQDKRLTVSRAGDDRPELVEGPGGDPGGLGHTVLAAADLSGGLVEPSLHVLLPVLVEVPIGDDIVTLRRHFLCKKWNMKP